MRAASVPSGVTVGVAGSESSRDDTLPSGEVKPEPNSSSGGTDGWLSMEASGMCRGLAEEIVELDECVRSASLSTLGDEVDASSSEAVVSSSDFVPLLIVPLTTITSCVLDALETQGKGGVLLYHPRGR